MLQLSVSYVQVNMQHFDIIINHIQRNQTSHVCMYVQSLPQVLLQLHIVNHPFPLSMILPLYIWPMNSSLYHFQVESMILTQMLMSLHLEFKLKVEDKTENTWYQQYLLVRTILYLLKLAWVANSIWKEPQQEENPLLLTVFYPVEYFHVRLNKVRNYIDKGFFS